MGFRIVRFFFAVNIRWTFNWTRWGKDRSVVTQHVTKVSFLDSLETRSQWEMEYNGRRLSEVFIMKLKTTTYILYVVMHVPSTTALVDLIAMTSRVFLCFVTTTISNISLMVEIHRCFIKSLFLRLIGLNHRSHNTSTFFYEEKVCSNIDSLSISLSIIRKYLTFAILVY